MWKARVRSGRAPVLPTGVRIYAVGDIHGRSDLLTRLLRSIDTDCRRRPVNRPITVFIGDYIDRGPASRDVLDRLVQWGRNHETVFLRGNHETFLPRFIADSKTLDEWRQCGRRLRHHATAGLSLAQDSLGACG